MAAMLVVMTIFAAYFAYVERTARHQREAVSWVHRVGGFVRYDWQPSATDQAGDPKFPPAPEILRRYLGDEPFQAVRSIGVGDPALDDIGPLATQGSVEMLFVSSQYFTYDLQPISNLRKLENLTLHAKEFDSLEPLINLPKLTYLEIRDTVIDDAVLDDFRQRRPDVMLIVTPPTSKRELSPGSRAVRNW
ncbi:hypothetical protein DSM3645_17065 [Blastopirellula marina DSM 3645]|uniref:Leucine Rich repeats (2 copies) n=1 Tax=Blastopirellula marina DSM 3645 TaxID=314230 RepID=A3ZNI8_9BACT|nr:hypothetical protein DSM3645_17065 [Blastopirellula marina DSM 3645]